MLNWQGWSANFLGWGAVGTAPTPAAPPVVGGGGRRKPLHYVEIDGKIHLVADAQAAQELLESVRNETQRKVAKRIAKPKTTAAEHIVPLVTISSPDPEIAHRMQAQADAFNANMRAMQAKYAAEMAELDDEEAIIALL
jgi:hypothetical protein